MTKAQFIKFIKDIPVPDDSILNISVDNEDIFEVKAVWSSTPSDDNSVRFCIDFSV